MPGFSLHFMEPEEFGKKLGVTPDKTRYLSSDVIEVCPIEGGMSSGRTSLMFVIQDDDHFVVFESSIAAVQMLYAALHGKYPFEFGTAGYAKFSSATRMLLLPRWTEAVEQVLQGSGTPITRERANQLSEMLMDALGNDSP